ncbi:MAG: GNAT family N-acetyltransferase [Thermodesulfobacteriota bacterium]
MSSNLHIAPFAPGQESEVQNLILTIQRGEFGLPITAADQPDLADIPGFYQSGCGNFWLARRDGILAGTVALKDIGESLCALRKMFVAREHRGAAGGVAAALLGAALDWSRSQAVRAIYLGTTERFLAAHRFYAKQGFAEIPREALPPSFPVMAVDTRFFHLPLA